MKNVRPLNGKPTISYPIRTAKKCPYIAKVMVTTDAEDIRKVAIECGAEAPFLRPAELATDTAKQEDAILHAMKWCEDQGEKYDFILNMTPATPLGHVRTYTKAFEMLTAHKDAEAVFSVCACTYSPLRCNTLRSDGLMKDWSDPKIKWLNRQEMPQYFRLSGMITLSKWETFKREKTFLHDTTLAYPVDIVESLDIDSPYDFFIAERLLEKGYSHSDQLKSYVRETLDGEWVNRLS